MQTEAGFTLLEVVILLAISGLVISSLVTINHSILEVYSVYRSQVVLEQELRVSLNTIVKYLQQAIQITDINSHSISFRDQEGELETIAYQPEVGLYISSQQNLLSQRISNLQFSLTEASLLLISLQIANQETELTLQTAIQLEEEQYNW
ncbi:PilW family protein [Halanaerobaculum tunisiense]